MRPISTAFQRGDLKHQQVYANIAHSGKEKTWERPLKMEVLQNFCVTCCLCLSRQMCNSAGVEFIRLNGGTPVTISKPIGKYAGSLRFFERGA